MRRSIGSVTEVSKGVYRVQVGVGYDRDTGRRVRVSRTVHGTLKDAERELTRLSATQGRVATAMAAATVAEFLESAWLPSKESEVRRRTFEGYEATVRNYVVPYIGQVKLRDLDLLVLKAWIAELKGHVGPRTIGHARALLRNAMNDAVALDLVARNPVEGTKAPKVEYEFEVLDEDGANAYLDAFAGHPLEAVVVLAIAGGLRRSELAALTWADIDFERGEVSVTKGMHQSGGEVWTEAPKSKTSRRKVVLPEWALATLSPLRGLGSVAGMKPDEISGYYERRVRESKLHYIPLRDLRHTSATILLDRGVPLDTISRRLGHANTTVTQAHYLKPHRVVDDVAAKQMGEIRRVPSRANSDEIAM